MKQPMIETTVTIDGMACAMCEAHIRDALRRELPVSRVRASHKRGVAICESRDTLSEEAIRKTVEATGYRVTAVTSAPKEARGLLALFKRR